MSKEIYISSTPHETRLAIVEKDELTEIYYERENEYTLAGSIYNGRVTRVLPGMQSSFVDIGLERDAFLYITDFMEEAGDSADFEAADGSRGRADRNKSNGRGRSDENGAAPVIEGEAPVRAEGEGRRDRGERGGRDRNRDRGDRARRDEVKREPQGEFVVAPVADEGFAPRDGGDEVGEGAPGADGGRRWRGRRGRRRGRGGNDELPEGSRTADEGFDAPVVEAAAVAPEGETRGRESAPRGDRGGRDRDRGGRERGGRDRGRLDAIRERFAPRGDRSPSANADE